MSARMEQVRAALSWSSNVAAALAEVEEWEARLAEAEAKLKALGLWVVDEALAADEAKA